MIRGLLLFLLCAGMAHAQATASGTAKGSGRGQIGIIAASTQYSLAVTLGGFGGVTASPNGVGNQVLSCQNGQGPGACTVNYISGTVVTLTETPGSGQAFVGWSGACSGSSTTCVLTITANTSVIATFVGYPLSVSVTGLGTVTASPNGIGGVGISCPSACSANYATGTVVTLTETPGSGYTFSGWGGACAGTATTCVLTITAATSVTATYTVASNRLTAVIAGTGTVTASPTGDVAIVCPTACVANYTTGTVVTLTETPGSGQVFTSWSGGGCSGSATTCAVTMSSDQTVTATFGPAPSHRVTVVVAGTGTVTASPSGDVAISCPTACSANYTPGTVVTLTETPGTGQVFSSWSGGGCSGSASTCIVTMSSNQTVTATFTALNYLLTVVVSGNGTVTASPLGSVAISCPSACSANYASGTVVTLTETPGSGQTFSAWSGACSGSATTCVVTMNSPLSATATFITTNHRLTVAVGGTGIVTASPTGDVAISCPSACAANYASGTVVTLTETPGTGQTFSGWSGACSGSATTCVVTMSSDLSVTATFIVATHRLTVAVAGTGTVTASPTGDVAISCPSACAANYANGTVVTLTETPSGGQVFSSWSGGGCSGSATTCAVTMSSDQVVTATFTGTSHRLTVVISGN
jgi:uncharacterized repeat protein (TIGR02543 family)